MTKDERMAAIGRLVSEYREAKERYTLLSAEARRIGNELQQFGIVLSSSPDHVSIDEQEMAQEYRPGRQYNSHLLDVDKLKALTKEIREAKSKMKELEQKIREFGLTP